MDKLDAKYQTLRSHLQGIGQVAVAFSGGVDSSLLLAVAHEVLGDRALALTAHIHAMPEAELEQARIFCAERGIEQLVLDIDELSIPGFRENPPDRCYHCKRGIFERLAEACSERGFDYLAEGSNTDDLGDYRPGSRAIRELGIASPLLDAGLSKADVRALSRQLGLPTWNKPSAACLASRFAYGQEISAEGLEMVEAAERFLVERGFGQVRVRVHDRLARIEATPDDMGLFAQRELREEISAQLRSLGFAYVTLDLAGYRTGSMNEVL